jgi:hypothetical protein
MTTIGLRLETIRTFMNSTGYFNGCQEIDRLFCRDGENHQIRVEARIPASSTRQGSYNIGISLQSDGSIIHYATCSCPIGNRCKHINKTLLRIHESMNNPIPGPPREVLEEEAQKIDHARKMDHASVYIALACKSELDSENGDFMRSYFTKDNVDQEILGVFFSKRKANQCARDHVEKDIDDDVDSDDEMSFVYDGSEYGEYGEGGMFQKVWVEQFAIDDASRMFHN